jgi:hypothetical protein
LAGLEKRLYIMEMFERKKVRFFVFKGEDGKYTIDVIPEGKKNFSVFFHTEKQAINFINETEWDDIN